MRHHGLRSLGLLGLAAYLASGWACALTAPNNNGGFDTGLDAGGGKGGKGGKGDGADSDDSAAPGPVGANNPPRAVIQRPTGDLLPGSQVPLDGSQSSDIDGDPLSFAWNLDSKPVGSTAALNNIAAPIADVFVDRDGEYVVTLVVDDGQANHSATVKFSVLPDNLPPKADAGIDQRIALGAQVPLSGALSKDPDGDPLEYRWEFISVPGAAPSLQGAVVGQYSATGVSPSFYPSAVGIYTLSLTVRDDKGLESQPDTVQITIYDPNASSASTSSSSSSGGCDLGCAEDLAAASSHGAQAWSAGGMASSAGLLLLPVMVALWHRRRDDE